MELQLPSLEKIVKLILHYFESFPFGIIWYVIEPLEKADVRESQ